MANDPNLSSAQVLIVDDEVEHAEVMAEALRRLGHVCTIVHDLPAAQDELRHGNFDLIVTDLVMDSETDGLEVLSTARQTQRNAETVLVTAHGDVPTCKAALKQGAFDFIEKPLDLELFRKLTGKAIEAVQLRSQVSSLRKQGEGDAGAADGIIGTSPAMQRVRATIQQVGPSDIPVLITGESGTGKELVARAVHNASPRVRKHFKPLNCAGLTESILESELFGHVKGAFTGAERDREGVFEYADEGTLFLDEIGDMPLTMQAKLLRVLESGEVVRVGANDARHVNVRLISATNRDLVKLTKENHFREDLYFRVRGAHINLPPLRERREDIPLLVRHYLEHFALQMRREAIGLSEEALLTLIRYDWPGNVRELMNVVRNMVLVCEGGELRLEHVPMELRSPEAAAQESAGVGGLTGMTLEQIEKQAIRNALRLNQGNRETTAKMLGIGERTLYRKLKEYGIK